MTTDKHPLTVVEVTPAYWHVTFDNPPINLFDPETFAALRLLMDRLEADPEVRVIVFDSANEDYFISQLDVLRVGELPDVPGAAYVADDWHNWVDRLTHLPVISIAVIRGIARGIGSEFALAADIRFASLEKAKFSQPEAAFGVVPGGGGLEWLSALLGRSRALEVVSSGDAYDATIAERYGWINRAIPDADLDKFVEDYVRRVAGFSKTGLALNKRLINERVAPAKPEDILESFKAIVEGLADPDSLRRQKIMLDRGWAADTPLELIVEKVVGELGYELAELDAQEELRSDDK